jgi:hypothetical protein
MKGARRAWLHRISSELATPDHYLRSVTPPFDSPPPRIIALHVVALHDYSSSSYCRARTRLGLATSHLHMSKPRASLTRSHFAGSASLLPRLAFRRTPWLRPRFGYRVSASRATALRRYSSCACRCSARRTPTLSGRARGFVLLRPLNTCPYRQLPRATTRMLAPLARHCP